MDREEYLDREKKREINEKHERAPGLVGSIAYRITPDGSGALTTNLSGSGGIIPLPALTIFAPFGHFV